ncbi:MAG: phosphoribosylamine--glycine ligase [Saprospiraceae bacterium]|nr:phosphoribosylamine--glycine ligase [Saprospiraceae bacterium]
MNVLILGSGGREHALSWKIAQSPMLDNLYIAPGNAGTNDIGQNVNLDILDFDRIAEFALSERIDMIIVGPEAPLVAGIFDYFENKDACRHIKIVGPSLEGSKLEGSKSYGKVFMQENGIPTAAYGEFTKDTLQEGIAHLRATKGPYVLKADGLAGGKGVLIIHDLEEAEEELKSMLSGKFGDASATVVIEEFLDGIEFSVFVLTDGERYKVLPVAKDYKRIGEGDTGLNTGGMGAVSPVPFVDDVMMKKVEDQIIRPTIAGLQKRKIKYIGFVFLGLISVDGEPKVIEYNCRMGDPETEVVMPRIESDLLPVLGALGTDEFDELPLEQDPRFCTTVMLVSGGYPEAYEKGKQINGINEVEDSIVFHAGTKQEDENVYTNGGRVIAVSSYGDSKDEAIAKSMKNAEKISFDKKNYRKDIGFDL